MKKEIYKDIPGYEGSYQVNNWGNVKSIKFGKERILKPGLRKNYFYVELSENGNVKKFQVHQLVAMAFLGHQPDGGKEVVMHKNHDKTDNRIENIKLGSVRDNSTDYREDIGCYWYERDKRWRTQISINSRQIHLGSFVNKQCAIDMYQKALENQHLYNGDNKTFRKLLNNGIQTT